MPLWFSTANQGSIPQKITAVLGSYSCGADVNHSERIMLEMYPRCPPLSKRRDSLVDRRPAMPKKKEEERRIG